MASPGRALSAWLDDPGLRTPLWIVGIAALVRLAWAAWIPIEPVSDSAMYDTFAQRIASGLGYAHPDGSPSAYFAVGPSFVYSLAYRSGLPPMPLVAFVQALVGAASVAAVMALARLWLPPRPSWIAGGLLALWPSQIQFTTVLASELLFTAVVLVAWLCWERRRGGIVARGLATGVALGLACYLRPVALLLLVPWALARAVQERAWRPTAAAALLAVVAMGLTIAPWSARNLSAFGEFVLISTNGGANLWMGNHPGTDGRYRRLPPEAAALGELERDAELGGRARAYILSEPVAFVGRTLSKFVRLHDRETIGVHWNERALATRVSETGNLALRGISTLWWWMALAAGLFGLVRWILERGWFGVFHSLPLTWLYFASVHAVIVIQDRYHFPVIPSVAILAGVGMAWWLGRLLPDAETTAGREGALASDAGP